MFVPLTVRFRLKAPLAVPLGKQSYALHLDSLVIAAMTMQQGRYSQGFALDGVGNINEDLFAPGKNRDVPLAVVEKNGVALYQASAAFYQLRKKCPVPFVYRHFWMKQGFEGLGKLGKSAFTRARVENYLCLVVPEVYFFCVGNRKALLELLRNIRGLGPGRQMGLGAVADVSVSLSTDANLKTFGLLRQGQPARYIPISFYPEGGSGWRQVVAAATPPYWLPSRQELCWAPDPRMVLPDAACWKISMRGV